MRPIQKYIGTASGRLEPKIAVIDAAFLSATNYARETIGAEGVDVVFVDAPHDALPEWGVGGATFNPFFILVSLDPGFTLQTQKIEATLVHEYHHAMRWRTTEFGADLAQLLVSEGLAQLFEEECLGERPFYSDADISQSEIEAANAELHDQPFDQGKWFFGAKDVTKHFGYTYGYRLCKKYSISVGKGASELLEVSAKDVLEHSLDSRSTQS
jgi:uncharacterized protein YjaZ